MINYVKKLAIIGYVLSLILIAYINIELATEAIHRESKGAHVSLFLFVYLYLWAAVSLILFVLARFAVNNKIANRVYYFLWFTYLLMNVLLPSTSL